MEQIDEKCLCGSDELYFARVDKPGSFIAFEPVSPLDLSQFSLRVKPVLICGRCRRIRLHCTFCPVSWSMKIRDVHRFMQECPGCNKLGHILKDGLKINNVGAATFLPSHPDLPGFYREQEKKLEKAPAQEQQFTNEYHLHQMLKPATFILVCMLMLPLVLVSGKGRYAARGLEVFYGLLGLVFWAMLVFLLEKVVPGNPFTRIFFPRPQGYHYGDH